MLSELDAAAALTGDELLLAVQGGDNVKATVQEVADFTLGDMQAGDIESAQGGASVLTTTTQSIGGQKTFTDPASFINAASQIQFGTAADQGFIGGLIGGAYMASGVKRTSAGTWEARQTAAALAYISGAGSYFTWNINTGLTIGNTFSPTEQMRLTATGLGVKNPSPGCAGDFAGTIRTTTNNAPSSGTGGEFYYSSGLTGAVVLSYDRSAAAYKNLYLDASSVALRPNGTAIATATTTGLDVTQPVSVVNSNSQVRFGTVSNQGSLLGTTAWSVLSWGAKWTGAAWEAQQTTAGLYAVHGAAGHIWYRNGSLTGGTTFTPTELGRWNDTGLGLGQLPGCKVDAAGTIRTTAATVPTSGTGGEFYHSGGVSYLFSIDRSASTYKELQIRASTLKLLSSGFNRLTIGTSVVEAHVPIQFASYTLATLPTAASHPRCTVWCSDLAAGAFKVTSNGTDWLDDRDGTIAA